MMKWPIKIIGKKIIFKGNIKFKKRDKKINMNKPYKRSKLFIFLSLSPKKHLKI